MTVDLKLESCRVRTYLKEDAHSIANHANNRKVWRNLRDAFPHPYTIDDAHEFIDKALQMEPQTVFAIVVDDQAVGGIGFGLTTDVERVSAEIGYWLGEVFWGRGIASQALEAVTNHAIDTYGLTRVFATPYEWSKASMRVLEKCGYVLEARMRRSAIKDGRVIDKLLYAYVP